MIDTWGYANHAVLYKMSGSMAAC